MKASSATQRSSSLNVFSIGSPAIRGSPPTPMNVSGKSFVHRWMIVLVSSTNQRPLTMMAMAGSSFLLTAFLPAEWPGHMVFVAPLLLGGAGAGLFIAPNSHLIMRSAPPERSASAGALISTTRLVGSALGAMVLAALLALDVGNGPVPALFATCCALVSALCSLANLLSRSRGLQGDHART